MNWKFKQLPLTYSRRYRRARHIVPYGPPPFEAQASGRRALPS